MVNKKIGGENFCFFNVIGIEDEPHWLVAKILDARQPFGWIPKFVNTSACQILGKYFVPMFWQNFLAKSWT